MQVSFPSMAAAGQISNSLTRPPFRLYTGIRRRSLTMSHHPHSSCESEALKEYQVLGDGELLPRCDDFAATKRLPETKALACGRGFWRSILTLRSRSRANLLVPTKPEGAGHCCDNILLLRFNKSEALSVVDMRRGRLMMPVEARTNDITRLVSRASDMLWRRLSQRRKSRNLLRKGLLHRYCVVPDGERDSLDLC